MVFDLPATALLVKDPSIDLKALADRIQKRVDADWGDRVVVECDEIKSLSGFSHAEGGLTIEARQGEKALHSYHLLAPAMVLFGGQGFPKGWPRPKLADVDAALHSAPPIALDVFDGKNGWTSGNGVAKLGTIDLKPTTRNSATALVNIGLFWWPSLRVGFGNVKVEALRDPARANLIVLHIEQGMPLKNGMRGYHADSLYWLDPAHDDLPVESVIRNNLGGDDNFASVRHFVYLDFARLADGRWYPSHWQYGTIASPTTQPTTRPVHDDRYREYWRQILQNEKLPPEWYGDPSLRLLSSGLALSGHLRHARRIPDGDFLNR